LFMLKRFRYKDGILTYDPSSLRATLKNKIYDSLIQGNNILIFDKNYITIRKNRQIIKELKGENYGLMVFK